MKSFPMVYIIAGPNGAGKTTFAMRYLPEIVACPNFINADMIAHGLSPFTPDTVSVEAGRLFLRRIHEFASRQVDFAFETTLAGRSYVRLFRKLRAGGYGILLFYLWVPVVDLSLKRIAARVREGGHNIPERVVRRRFTRSIHNLLHVYRNLCDEVVVFDNQGASPHKAVLFKGREELIHDPLAYEIMLKQASEET